MKFAESDDSLKEAYEEIIVEKDILTLRLGQLGAFEQRIKNLKLIDKTTRYSDDSSEVTFISPKNQAGNDMDNNYRNSQMVDLITNIDAAKSDNAATSYYASQ